MYYEAIHDDDGKSINVAHHLRRAGYFNSGHGISRIAHNHRVANALLGGWQIGTIVTVQTGFPFTVVWRRSLKRRHRNRPNATGATVALPRGQQDPQRFFNTSAFVLQPFGSFGNVGRNTVIGPGILNLDFSTGKHFRIREGHQLEFRFEVFNMPNHPNWGLPNGTANSPNFGKVTTTATDMRDLQFGLKYVF